MADDTRRLAAAGFIAPHPKVALPDELGVRGKKQTKATYRTAPTPDRAWEWRGPPAHPTARSKRAARKIGKASQVWTFSIDSSTHQAVAPGQGMGAKGARVR